MKQLNDDRHALYLKLSRLRFRNSLLRQFESLEHFPQNFFRLELISAFRETGVENFSEADDLKQILLWIWKLGTRVADFYVDLNWDFLEITKSSAWIYRDKKLSAIVWEIPWASLKAKHFSIFFSTLIGLSTSINVIQQNTGTVTRNFFVGLLQTVIACVVFKKKKRFLRFSRNKQSWDFLENSEAKQVLEVACRAHNLWPLQNVAVHYQAMKYYTIWGEISREIICRLDS